MVQGYFDFGSLRLITPLSKVAALNTIRPLYSFQNESIFNLIIIASQP